MYNFIGIFFFGSLKNVLNNKRYNKINYINKIVWWV